MAAVLHRPRERSEAYSSTGTDLGELDGGPAYGVSVDPADDHVYVDRGDVVLEYDENGEPYGTPIGPDPERVSSSVGVAANHGAVVVTSRGTTDVAYFGSHVFPPDPKLDNPLVVHSLEDSEVRNSGDFQVNRSGEDAVFTSTLPLTEYENVDRREVLRYDAGSNKIDCASCNPTGEPAVGDGTLAPNGRSLTDDGRVFFNSTEGLVDRDLNEVKDAYEWTPAQGVELISTGTEPLPSSLLGVSSDGIDAYFFTRGTLVPEDENGSRVKIYDARSFGGFAYVPKRIPCKASDECHGPGTEAAPPPACGPSPAPRSAISTKAKPKCKRHNGKKCHRRHGKGGTTSPARERRSIPTEAVGVADARGRTKETLTMTTDYPTVAAPSPAISRLRLGLILICALLGLNVLAGEADASLKVESFSTTSSNSEAGGHPDLSTSFRLSRTGRERGGPERHFPGARGHLRESVRDHPLHLLGLRDSTSARPTRRPV